MSDKDSYTEENIERIRGFVLELTELSRKYGLCIGVCGCCDGPSVNDLNNEDLIPGAGYGFEMKYENCLQWITPETFNWQFARAMTSDTKPGDPGWGGTPSDE